jgi:Skp family chaperone for outer membrane proteins
MNDLLKKLLPALILVSLCAPVWGQARIGTVDWNRVFEGYWKTKQAVAQFKDRVADMDKELAGMVEELKKADEQYKKLLEEANAPAISTEERDRRKKTAEDKLKALKESEVSIKQFKDSATSTLDEQRKRMRDNLSVEIKAAIAAQAKADNYTMVLDTATAPNSDLAVVLYTTGDNDISKKVLDQLNKTDPSGTKPEEKKDTKSK